VTFLLSTKYDVLVDNRLKDTLWNACFAAVKHDNLEILRLLHEIGECNLDCFLVVPPAGILSIMIEGLPFSISRKQ
jgi:hypothetical protein